jgi:hypothetical protein
MRGAVGDPQLSRAARELQERNLAAFEERGGLLRVSAGKASDLRSRTKSIELYAGVEWDRSHMYDHTHAEIARRPWFSRRWQRVRSLRDATEKIEADLAEWIREHS